MDDGLWEKCHFQVLYQFCRKCCAASTVTVIELFYSKKKMHTYSLHGYIVYCYTKGFWIKTTKIMFFVSPEK